MLETIISKKGFTIRTLANELGICENALKDKINRKSEFKVGEVLKISGLLKLSYNEVTDIFFR